MSRCPETRGEVDETGTRHRRTHRAVAGREHAPAESARRIRREQNRDLDRAGPHSPRGASHDASGGPGLCAVVGKVVHLGKEWYDFSQVSTSVSSPAGLLSSFADSRGGRRGQPVTAMIATQSSCE